MMGTQFKVGDKVELTEDYGGYAPGTRGTVMHVKNDSLLTVGLPDGSTFKAFSRRFKKVTQPDPSKVKAGDTVTLEDRRNNVHDDSITPDPDWRLTGKVRGIHVTHSHSDGTPYAWNVRIGHTPYQIGTADWTYTLTAHQPAPEPEGDLADLIAGKVSWPSDDFGGHKTGAEIAAAIREQFVVIAPAVDVDRFAAIIRKVDGNHSLGAGALAEAILTELGIGAP